MQGGVGASVGLKPLPSIDSVGDVGYSDSGEKSVENNLNLNKLSIAKTDINKKSRSCRRKVQQPYIPYTNEAGQGFEPYTRPYITLHYPT